MSHWNDKSYTQRGEATMRGGCLLRRREIEALLAHRWPMLYVDQVTKHDVGSSLVARAFHYPASQLWQLEAMGQAAGLLIRQTPKYADYKLPAFAAMRDVCWSVGPDRAEYIELQVRYSTKKKSRARFGFVDAKALADGKSELCTAELCFSFIEEDE